MASLADKAILSGAENRPPMLEKDTYDSWRSRMEMYMLNKQHGRIILELVEHGPLLWPSVTEEGVTRLKKYSELSAAEAIQADCDVKATNIILQALPLEIYALAILSGGENRPPMLKKDMYISWRSRMEMYMLNRQHGRIFLESVEHGPLLWPFVTEEGVTRFKKYYELSASKAIQANCDVKATNIILQALPPKIYAL
nr:hypothetical protein [Tanacetum cinerariifolium]